MSDVQVNKNSDGKRGLLLLAAFILFAAAFIIVRLFVLEKVVVSGQSMEPMFHNGDVCLQLKSGYELERFDVVVAEVDGEFVIKRVIALPTETIQILDGVVFINGDALTTDVGTKMDDAGCASASITLSDDEYFLIGDNRNNSVDCRVWGSVKEDQIDGKVILRYFPFDEISSDWSRITNGDDVNNAAILQIDGIATKAKGDDDDV